LACTRNFAQAWVPTFSSSQFHSFNPLMQLPFADSLRNADRTFPSSERL
jgi:hypothetical protein